MKSKSNKFIYGLLSLLLFASSTACFGQTVKAQTKAETKSSEDTSVRGIVNRLFESMEAKRADALRALFTPEGRLVSTFRRQGETAVRVLTLDDFLKLVMETKEPFRERMFDVEVRVEGDMATVWGRYDFHVGARLTNCGYNSIQLVRVREEWKIVNIASTIITQGCQASK